MPTGVGSKSSATDLVSDADREAEARIVGRIRAARPDDAIVAEEGSAQKGGSGIRWLVDPLDGTVNFLYGIPQWSVSIAALDGEGPLAAVVYDPSRDELFAATRGGGARLNGAPIRTTGLSELSNALVTTGFSYVAEERARQALHAATLAAHVADLRRLGSAALDLAWVSCGRVDAYTESVANPWDWAAGRLLVTEAGGRVSEIAGVRAGMPGICASAPAIHDALLELLRVQTR